MKWFLLIGMTLIGLILLVTLMGWILPQAHRATQMARFNQPPGAVFALITGPQDWRGVTKIELPPNGGRRQWREDSSHHSITFEESASTPPFFYRTRIADKNLPFGGTWSYEITPTPDGCTCRIVEEGETYNPIFRFMSRYVFGYTKSIDDYLTAMGKKFNQPVKIEE